MRRLPTAAPTHPGPTPTTVPAPPEGLNRLPWPYALALPTVEKFVLATMLALSTDDECSTSCDDLAALVGVTDRTITRTWSSLSLRGHLTVVAPHRQHWPTTWRLHRVPADQPAEATADDWTFNAPRRGFYLYRLWGPEDRLLYIGVSRQLRARLRRHRSERGLYVTQATWTQYATEADMMAAESAAIIAEAPPLNGTPR